MTDEPKYTIEQIELLRRLLQTGLSRDDIIHAIDSMSRFEREFGGHSSHARTGQTRPLHSPGSSVEPTRLNSPSQQASPQSSSIGRLDPAGTEQMLSDTVDTTSYQFPQGHQPTSSPVPMNVTRHDVIQSPDRAVIQPALKVDQYQVSDEEIQELMSKGLSAMRDEIREFLTQNHLSQNQLGRDIGVSGSYISQYFHNMRSMRTQTVERMCKWYIGKKKELEGVEGPPPSAQTSYSTLIRSPVNRFSPYRNPVKDPDQNFRIRRLRFVWKEGCTKVLEAYFQRNPYPTDVERIRLSDTCNEIQRVAGHSVPDSCVVTPERVYHWFANRRKEISKRKRLSVPDGGSQTEEGAVPTSAVDAAGDSQTLPLSGLSPDQHDDKDGSGNDVSGHMIDEDDDHPRDPKEIANELQEVNNSIITFMKAVEEKSEEAKPDVLLNE